MTADLRPIAGDEATGLAAAPDRIELRTGLLARRRVARAAEVGVFRGRFAAAVLDRCPSIERHHLIDRWRHREDGNEPASVGDDILEDCLGETLERTGAHADRRVVLRGRTTEVADEIADDSLDFAYVDGDHTLRGTTVDLVRMWPKLRPGGLLAGDDLSRSVHQHAGRFEPTPVLPFGVYFAEAVDAPVWALPHGRFLIQKPSADEGGDRPHAFVDPTGRYDDPTPASRVRPRRVGRANRQSLEARA